MKQNSFVRPQEYPNKNCFTTNYLFAHTLKVLNANLVFYQTMALVCQHVTVDLEMIISPSKFDKDWRQVMSVMLDFHAFKQAYAQRHYELVGEIQEGQELLAQQTNLLAQQIDRKCMNERLKGEMAEKEGRMQFEMEEARIMLEEEMGLMREQELMDEEMAREEARLEAEYASLCTETQDAEYALEEQKSLLISSPERVSMDREVALEELKLLQEQLDVRKKIIQGPNELASTPLTLGPGLNPGRCP